ncbi:MAG: hypothetical protein WKF78_09040 [Candidatus Limnocylindrales bacterium]
MTSNGNEFTNFTQIPEKEGTQAAEIVLKWMKDNGKDLKVFAVSGGDPTAFWAQGRMKFFKETIMAAIPDATFVNDETNALATTFDAAKTLDAYKAFLAGNPDGPVHRERGYRCGARLSGDQGSGQGRRDQYDRLECQPRPARRDRCRYAGGGARPEVVRAGRLRRTRLR